MSQDGDTGLAPQPLTTPERPAPSADLSGTVMVPSPRARPVAEVTEGSGSVDAPRPLPGAVRAGRERESSLAPHPISRAPEPPEGRLGWWVAGIGCGLAALFGSGLAVSALAVSLLR